MNIICKYHRIISFPDCGSDSITQIAAMVYVDSPNTESFDRYVWPLTELTQNAADLTCITVDRTSNTMTCNGQQVEFMQPNAALRDFIAWLKKISEGKVYLVAHNCWKFDAPVILKAVRDCCLEDVFDRRVAGFLDTLPAFRMKYKDLGKYALRDLVDTFLEKDYTPFNAIDHVRVLTELIREGSILSDLLHDTRNVEEIRAQIV